MDNYKFNIDDYISSIENNNKQEIELNTQAIYYHVNTVFKELLINYIYSSFFETCNIFNHNKVLYNVHKTNIHIIKQELKIAIYLMKNINYFYNIDNKDFAIALVNIYYYLILTDFNRIDFVELNSNKGRTFIADYLLNEINECFEKLIENLNTCNRYKNILVKDINNEK